MYGISGTPDIRPKAPGANPSSFLVVELKDSARLSKRLEIEDDQFKSYLYQALSYLVMTDIENAIIAIKYFVPELIWQKRDSKGNNHYIKPHDGRPPEIQSWGVFMSMDDPLREGICSQMLERRRILQRALGEDDVSFLPRLIGKAKYIRCRKCPFYQRCYGDPESEYAMQMAREPNVLDQLAVEIASD